MVIWVSWAGIAAAYRWDIPISYQKENCKWKAGLVGISWKGSVMGQHQVIRESQRVSANINQKKGEQDYG